MNVGNVKHLQLAKYFHLINAIFLQNIIPWLFDINIRLCINIHYYTLLMYKNISLSLNYLRRSKHNRCNKTYLLKSYTQPKEHAAHFPSRHQIVIIIKYIFVNLFLIHLNGCFKPHSQGAAHKIMCKKQLQSCYRPS